MRKTKIVATISDKKCNKEFIQTLFNAGMDVARINTAHITLESGKKMVENIRAVSKSIAILIDTKGPEIRTCGIQNEIKVTEGEMITLSNEKLNTGAPHICVNYKHIVSVLEEGNKILVDDGAVEIIITNKNQNYLSGRIENTGTIKNNKSLNIPGVSIDLPSLSEKDKMFIEFAVENDLDFIAHSFVRNKNDISKVQEIIDEQGGSIKIIAKIENLEGVNNIDEILQAAYGIMVARGDLGIELPAERIPTLQRNLIRKAIIQKKPVIIATQMLHSMIEQPRPTRAEISDVAGAIYSRSDAIMLSGETAYGKYPVEAIKTMVKVAKEVEPDRDKRYDVILPPINNEIPAYLAQSAIRAAKELKPQAIITATTTGKTARYLSAYRSNTPIFALCHSQKVMRELALSFGIFPSFLEIRKHRLKIQKAAIRSLLVKKIIHNDDLIIYVGGRFGEDCGASFIEISTPDKLFQKKPM